MNLVPLRDKRYVANTSDADNVIGEGSCFEGSIETDQTIRIDGFYYGQSLRAKEVIIGKTGRVKANIFTKSLILEGVLWGDIIANVRVVLQPNCKLVGNVSTTEIIITKSVEFEGMCRVIYDLNVDVKEVVKQIFKEGAPRQKEKGN